MITGATSILLNNQGDNCCNIIEPAPYCRTRNCDTQFNSHTPSSQYQRQKIIQNTVRVPCSLYTMNIASLGSYEKPSHLESNVPWNQMSDRAFPHVQPHLVASGGQYSGNSTKRTITRLRPGALCPGGKGVDIKHNSYERRLNRLKGRALLRAGPIPLLYGAPIPFNRAYPIYGGKIVKTGIVSGCICPTKKIEPSLFPNNIYNVKYTYNICDKVYAQEKFSSCTGKIRYSEATILEQQGNCYLVEFVCNGLTAIKCTNEILPYFPCNCEDLGTSFGANIIEYLCGGKTLSLSTIKSIIQEYFYAQ